MNVGEEVEDVNSENSSVISNSDEYESYNISYYNDLSLIRLLQVCFQNSLTSNSPRVTQPEKILVSLKPHQQAIVYEMEKREMASLQGLKQGNSTTYINFGVLGDNVGSGKSLSILSHIARMNSPQFRNTPLIKMELQDLSRSNCFTIHHKTIHDNSGANLIVVPHTIFKQWTTYAKTQTNLVGNFIKTKKDISCVQTTLQNIYSSDFTLVSNTLFSDFMDTLKQQKVVWKRVFIDEIDTIKITRYTQALKAGFVWFISATWQNYVLCGSILRPRIKHQVLLTPEKYHPDFIRWLQQEFSPRNDYIFFRTQSARWLADYVIQTIFGGMSVLRTEDNFLKESQAMPQIFTQIVLCQQSRMNRLVYGEVGPEIREMLHAGDVTGALEQLGVTTDNPMTLIEAINAQRHKDLDRLQKTYDFKASIDYATPQAKESALENLREKIQSLKTKIESFQKRVEEAEKELCPICYCEPQPITMTPCCNHIFCGGCLLTSITSHAQACPLCRQKISAKEIRHLDPNKKQTKKDTKAPTLLSKSQQLINLLKQNPNGRFLVFSRYDNPFNELATECEALGIQHDILKGNKDTIASTIKQFEQGKIRVLFLHTQTAGAGMNLVSASHVVLLHAMTQEEEKQVVGRAFRLGRTEPLQVVKLVHESEIS